MNKLLPVAKFCFLVLIWCFTAEHATSLEMNIIYTVSVACLIAYGVIVWLAKRAGKASYGRYSAVVSLIESCYMVFMAFMLVIINLQYLINRFGH